MKKLVYLMILAVFFGTQILAINVGFKLSLYRVLFLTISFIFLTLVINNDERVRFYPNKISNQYTLFYCWWVVSSLLSVIWVENIGGWIRANLFITIGILSIIYIQLFIKEKKDLMSVFKIIALGTNIHILLGLTELITGRYQWASQHFMTKYRPGSNGFFSRIPISIYPNENDYATMLLMGSFFILLLFKLSDKLYKKAFLLLSWLLAIFLMNQTSSRANVLALLMGLGVMFMAYIAPIISRRFVQVVTGITGGAVIALLIGMPAMRSKVSALLYLFSPEKEFAGTSNEIRINLLRNGLTFVRETFGFGVGAGNVEYWMANKAAYQTGGMTNMHNWWMEIITAYGLITFILYLFVYFGMILKSYHYYRYSNDYFVRQVSLINLGYLVAFTMSSISSATNIVNEWQWLVFGIMLAFYSYCERISVRNQLSIPKDNYNFTFLGGNHG
ncbi:O-antigen ligase family protein [Jeotgalibaca porci]|uniref:O-antigen ligase family protein n=2 Tax=Jeotgalibaca porci TaxID=1868793 RepID=A0A6G7WG29_9LACT|nr:O-antigen ligase family protein [Jeotgalibaca porci]